MERQIQQTNIDDLLGPDIEAAVRRLYNAYFEAIVVQICNQGGSREDGADVFQEAVIVLIEKVRTGQFRGESSIKTFLSAIARNLWLFECRTRERRRKREQLYMVGEELTTEGKDMVGDKNTVLALRQVMGEIGEKCRQILKGFYFEKKSYRDLLKEVDMQNEQVLRNKKSKCLKKLKELLTSTPELIREYKPLPFYE
jgi:RNA polymerase sigma factor (sigma-70 family)